MNAIETSCPWLLRYMAAASILSGKNTKDVARYCGQEKYQMQDPLCVVFEGIFANADLDSVAGSLKEVEEVRLAFHPSYPSHSYVC
jgi:translation initiation factor 3 subunit E